MYHTIVTWENGSVTESIIQQIHVKVASMESEAKTDGTWIQDPDGSDQYKITREWIDEAAAQEWEVFIMQFNPVAVEIVPV